MTSAPASDAGSPTAAAPAASPGPSPPTGRNTHAARQRVTLKPPPEERPSHGSSPAQSEVFPPPQSCLTASPPAPPPANTTRQLLATSRHVSPRLATLAATESVSPPALSTTHEPYLSAQPNHQLLFFWEAEAICRFLAGRQQPDAFGRRANADEFRKRNRQIRGGDGDALTVQHGRVQHGRRVAGSSPLGGAEL